MLPSKDRFSRLRGSLPIVCLVICVLQPLLDVLSYWQVVLEMPNYVTLVLRLGLLGVMLLCALPFLRRKGLCAILLLAVLCYLCGHVLACVGVSSAYDWKEDLADQTRLLMLPVTAFCLIVYLQANEKVYSALRLGLVIDLAVILGIMALSAVTGTDPHTYAAKGIGVRGWFFWTSAQSAILSLLCPVVIAWTLERFGGKPLPLAAACLLSFGALFAFGTRLAYASLAVTGLCLCAAILISDKKRYPQALTVFLCMALFLALYPVSPMTKNQSEVLQNAEIKQQRVDCAAAEAAAQLGLDPAEEGRRDLRVLAAAYRYNLQGLVDRFGIERVAAAYEDSLDVVRICDDRVRKLIYCRLLAEDCAAKTPLAPLFGMEIGQTHTAETEIYVFETDEWTLASEPSDPENDFFGVYYLCGIVGLGLLILFFLYFILNCVKALGRDPGGMLSPVPAAFLTAFGIALVYGWSTVSVLRRNNASFYFAVILACLWHLCRNQASSRRKKESV